jgi:hypothetical protein
VTAVASLVLALVFNALQVRDSAQQARENKQATELQLLTQLNGLVAESQVTVDPLSREFRRAEGAGVLSAKTNASFGQVLKNMDYLAWLFDDGFIAIPGARHMWQRRMECLYSTAILVYDPTTKSRLPNLERLIHPGDDRAVTRLRDETC